MKHFFSKLINSWQFGSVLAKKDQRKKTAHDDHYVITKFSKDQYNALFRACSFRLMRSTYEKDCVQDDHYLARTNSEYVRLTLFKRTATMKV